MRQMLLNEIYISRVSVKMKCIPYTVHGLRKSGRVEKDLPKISSHFLLTAFQIFGKSRRHHPSVKSSFIDGKKT